jgi:hypothetical protein
MNINSIQIVNYNVRSSLNWLNLRNWFVILINPEFFRHAESIYINFSFQFLIITWLYSCGFESKIEFPNCNACFAWRCLKLWNHILIIWYPSYSRHDKSIYIIISLLSLKITLLYSCECEYSYGFAQGIAQQRSRGTPAGDVRQQ